MAAVIVHRDSGAQEKKICHCFHFSSSICHEVMAPDAMILVFLMLRFKTAFSLSSFTLIKRLFSFSSLSVSRVPCAYLRLLIFLPAILIPACDSSSPAFCRKYSVYRLNKQDDNVPPWGTSFPNVKQISCSMSSSNVVFWPACRFLRKQIRWYSHLFTVFPQFVVICTCKGFSVVSKTGVDVSLESPLLSPWSSECWQFDLWFFCLS